MKTRTNQFVFLLIVVFFSTSLIGRSQSDSNNKQAGEVIQLFNGKDLSNWTFFL